MSTTNDILTNEPLTNETLSDELLSINSIYSEDTLTPSSPDTQTYALRLPSLPSIVLRIQFPSDYPDAPPSILGTQSVGEDVQKGVGNRVVDIVRRVLGDVYTPGSPCVFDLLEEVKDAIEKAEEDGFLRLRAEEQHEHEHQDSGEAPTSTDSNAAPSASAVPDIGPSPPWTLAPPITEKKSIFLARCAPVSSPAQARTYLAHLLATDKRVARATHNITAWRIRGSPGPNGTGTGTGSNNSSGTVYQDCDDDGETAAGGRVLHLMQVMDVWDVMVVVSRWYGGVLLGPDRFRVINSAARGALVLGGFVAGAGAGAGEKEGKDGKEGGGGGKKGRR
jgi:hypothetical protein